MRVKEIDVKDSIGEGAYYNVSHIDGNLGPVELHVMAVINALLCNEKNNKIIYLQDDNFCMDIQKEEFKTQLNTELGSRKFNFLKAYLSKKFYNKYETETCYFEIE